VRRSSLLAGLAAGELILTGAAFVVVAASAPSLGGGDELPAVGVGPVSRAVAAARPASRPFPKLTETRVRVGRSTFEVVVADEGSERLQGLRKRRHLGEYDGMLFVFNGPTTTSFTMSTVPVPLEIAFYDTLGREVDRLHMEPCGGTDLTCPLYRSSAPFVYALETLNGKLPKGRLLPKR
jgi:uncharacterized membrane protein (UPF0127 family)